MTHKTQLTLALGVLSILSGCGGSDDGDGSPFLANSDFRLDSSNSQQVMEAVALQMGSIRTAVGYRLETDSAVNLNSPGLFSIISQHRDRNDLAARSDFAVTNSGACNDGGTYSDTYDYSYNSPIYSETGTASYNQCNVFGAIYNGTISYSYQENDNTLDYSDQASGALTMTILASPPSFPEDVVFSFGNLQFIETGNYGTSTYTISQLSFNMSLTSPSLSFGIAVSLNAPIVETSGDACPESGTIVISDSGGNSATGTFNGSTVEVVFNGSSVGSVSCY